MAQSTKYLPFYNNSHFFILFIKNPLQKPCFYCLLKLNGHFEAMFSSCLDLGDVVGSPVPVDGPADVELMAIAPPDTNTSLQETAK